MLVAEDDATQESSEDALAVEGGTEYGLNSLRTLKFTQAFNDSAFNRFGNAWMAVGAMIMLLGWQ